MSAAGWTNIMTEQQLPDDSAHAREVWAGLDLYGVEFQITARALVLAQQKLYDVYEGDHTRGMSQSERIAMVRIAHIALEIVAELGCEMDYDLPKSKRGDYLETSYEAISAWFKGQLGRNDLAIAQASKRNAERYS